MDILLLLNLASIKHVNLQDKHPETTRNTHRKKPYKMKLKLRLAYFCQNKEALSISEALWTETFCEREEC